MKNFFFFFQTFKDMLSIHNILKIKIKIKKQKEKKKVQLIVIEQPFLSYESIAWH